MQVYYSALAFDEYGSLVQSHYRASSPHTLPNVFGHTHDVVHAGGVSAVAVSRSGDLIATAGKDIFIRLWDGGRRKIMEAFVDGHTGGVTSITFSSDGSLLASGSMNGTVSIWTVHEERGLTLLTALVGNGSEVECLAISDDSKSIICKCRDGTIDVWSIAEKTRLSYIMPILVSL
jgi:WD40 repeat protein